MSRRRSGCLETAAIVVFALLLGAFAASTWLRHAGHTGGPAGGEAEPAPVPPATRARIRIDVRNGSGEPGAAQAMTAFLRERGFDVVDYGNADRFDYERTEIVAHGADPEPAREVGTVLPGVPIRGPVEASAYLDVTVVIGRDMDEVLSRSTRPPAAEPTPGWRERIGGWLERLRWWK